VDSTGQPLTRIRGQTGERPPLFPSRHSRASIPARLWPWLLLAFVAVYVAAHWATRVVPDSLGGQAEAPARAFMDFDIYLTGARQLAAGNSVYAPTENLPRPECIGDETLEYIYTPLLAVLLRPWSAMSPCTAERAWFALNCLACASLPLLLVLAIGRARSPGWWALALGLVGAPMATLETVSLGQVNALVLALMLGFVVLARRGRLWPAALLLALAFGLKLVPLALALTALASGRRRLLVPLAVAVAVVAVASFALAPGSTPAQFREALDRRTVDGLTQLNNASWVAAAARAGDAGPETIRTLVRANLLLVALAAAVAWWRGRAERGSLRLVAVGFALSAALSPVFEAHHQMLLYPCLLVLALAFSREPRAIVRVGGFVGLVVLAAMLNSRGLVRVEQAHGLAAHLLVKPAGVALWALIAWLLCLRTDRLE
jgi:alpha-1,2-mannosyltransferase